jgi:hypothetical protein
MPFLTKLQPQKSDPLVLSVILFHALKSQSIELQGRSYLGSFMTSASWASLKAKDAYVWQGNRPTLRIRPSWGTGPRLMA